MSLGALYLAGLAYTAVCIFGPGFAFLAILRRHGWLRTETPASHILSAAAVAIYGTAIYLSIVVAFGIVFDETVAAVKLAADAALILAGIAWAPRELRLFARSIARSGVTVPVTLGAIAGSWAFLQFPHVLDSSQLAWTQGLLTRGEAHILAPMMGFSGLIAFPGRWFDAVPVVTLAAVLKPFLGILAGAVAHAAAESFAPRHRLPAAVLILALMLVSAFGLYGLLPLGKDSIYGVLFSVAFMAVLCRPEPQGGAIELGLYFAAAAATGVIALPFMLGAYVLWLLIAPPQQKPLSTLRPVYFLAIPVLPVAVAGFFHIEPLVPFAVYLVLGGVVLAASRLPFAPLTRRAAGALEVLRRYRAWLPAALLLPCPFLLPLALPVTAWRNDDGSLVTELRAPLDGNTGFVDYMLAFPHQAGIVIVGMAGAVALGFFRIGRERAGVVAVAAMPFAVLLGALLHAKMGLPLVPSFNIWDIVKDIPLWYGGALFGVLAIGLIVAISSLVPPIWAQRAILAACGAGLVAAAAKDVGLAEFRQPVHYTATGGHANRDFAVASDIAWRELRGRTAHFDMSLALSRAYFYSFQMFEVRPTILNLGWLEKQKFPAAARIGIVAGLDKLPWLQNFAAARRASIVRLAEIEGGAGVFLAIDFDGHARTAVASSGLHARLVDGSHEPETAGGMRFVWVRASARVAIVAAGGPACVRLDLFRTGIGADRQIVEIAGGAGEAVRVDLAGTSMAQPRRAVVRLAANAGLANLRLDARFAEGRFPSDARPVAFGLRLPIAVEDGDRCRP